MFLISDAHAQTAGVDPTGGLMSFLPLIIIFAIFYFMMIRPQMKRQKELRAMLDSLKKGDEVTTGGGMVCKILSLDENFVTLEVSRVNGQSVEVVFQRNAIQSVLPNGTLKL